MTYPSGNVVGVTYDSRGRMSAESDVVSGISYNVAGQVTGLTLVNGVSESWIRHKPDAVDFTGRHEERRRDRRSDESRL